MKWLAEGSALSLILVRDHFLYLVFLSWTLIIHKTVGGTMQGQEPSLFVSAASTCKYWGTYLELCIWDFTWPGFPSQDIKIWLNFELHFNWWCNAFWFELKKQRIQTRINFHLSTTNASTDQVSWAPLDHCQRFFPLTPFCTLTRIWACMSSGE